ncbi:MAG: hypothetical protein ACRDPL_17775, partial [Propionibacteriaceae bacterium]
GKVTEPNEVTSPPLTDNATIDGALLGLADLASAPLSDHHDRLAKAHDVLHEALDPPEDQSENAEPR